MKYFLKDCETGNEAAYETAVEIEDLGEDLLFRFCGEKSLYYCAGKQYNDIHSRGDAFEILIGTDPARKVYYEIELSPMNILMVAKMENVSKSEQDAVKLNIGFVPENECFVKSSVTRENGGYSAELRFPKSAINTGDGEIYFNCYRLETDGGEMEKHLFALFPTMRRKFHTPSKFRYLKDYANK